MTSPEGTDHALMYIGGSWVPSASGDLMPVIDPATEEEVARVPRAGSEDAARALAAAARGQELWEEVDAWERARILRSAAQVIQRDATRLARLLRSESGKPQHEAEAEVLLAAELFDWYADEARRVYGRIIAPRRGARHILVQRTPIGVVAAFTPWNFPAVLPARKIAAALGAGCAVVLRPAEETPLTALALAAACEEAGLPGGVLNVVTTDAVGLSYELIADPVVRQVSFTGSTQVGREIGRAAADAAKPACLELGGHAPVLVLDDADVPAAAKACASAKFRNAGQTCVAPSRFYVGRAVLDDFTETFLKSVSTLSIGPDGDVGPLATQRRLAAVEAFVDDARHNGATVLCGGRRPPLPQAGYWYEPTVLVAEHERMQVFGQEPFGPIAPIVAVDDVDDATGRSNRSELGLAAYVFSSDLSRALDVAAALDVGIVGINRFSVGMTDVPFGGVKQSGSGRENGPEGIETYLTTKAVVVG